MSVPTAPTMAPVAAMPQIPATESTSQIFKSLSQKFPPTYSALDYQQKINVDRHIMQYVKVGSPEDVRNYNMHMGVISLVATIHGIGAGSLANFVAKRFYPANRFGYILPTMTAFMLGSSLSMRFSDTRNKVMDKLAADMTPLGAMVKKSIFDASLQQQQQPITPGFNPATAAAFNVHPSNQYMMMPQQQQQQQLQPHVQPIAQLTPQQQVVVPQQMVPVVAAPAPVPVPVTPSTSGIPTGRRTWADIRAEQQRNAEAIAVLQQQLQQQQMQQQQLQLQMQQQPIQQQVEVSTTAPVAAVVTPVVPESVEVMAPATTTTTTPTATA